MTDHKDNAGPDILAEIKRKMPPPEIKGAWYVASGVETKWLVEEVERLRIAGHDHDPQSCKQCSGHPFA